MVMRKLFTGLVLIPLGLIFVVFAVANRHLVTVSFDPFNSADPSVSVRLPLFVLIIAVAILGVVAGGSAAGAARPAGTRPMRGRRAPNWPICAPQPRPRATTRSAFPPRSRGAFMDPVGETSRARRCRTRAQTNRFFRLLPPS